LLFDFSDFSEPFSLGSTALSAVLDVCDLFSQVDSEEALGSEEMSSSLTRVEADEVPKSGEETLDATFGSTGKFCFAASRVPFVWGS
jgi:hypothetical protein